MPIFCGAEQRYININKEKEKVMTITNNVSNYNDVSLANKSSLGIFPSALFLCLFGQGVQKITN